MELLSQYAKQFYNSTAETVESVKSGITHGAHATYDGIAAKCHEGATYTSQWMNTQISNAIRPIKALASDAAEVVGKHVGDAARHVADFVWTNRMLIFFGTASLFSAAANPTLFAATFPVGVLIAGAAHVISHLHTPSPTPSYFSDFAYEGTIVQTTLGALGTISSAFTQSRGGIVHGLVVDSSLATIFSGLIAGAFATNATIYAGERIGSHVNHAYQQLAQTEIVQAIRQRRLPQWFGS